MYLLNVCNADGVVDKIESVKDHQQWELQFERLFIQPVLNVCIISISQPLYILCIVYTL